MNSILLDSLPIWTTAQAQKTSNRGISASNQQLLGIQKLRELILELAVRGKLVPQDLNDEPASELLKNIEDERKKRIKDGTVKKKEVLPEIVEKDKTFQIPEKWEWTRLGHVCEIIRGITFSANEKSKTPEFGRVACLRTTNVQNTIEWEDLLYIRELFVKREDQFIRENDIVMSMANSRELVGKVAIVDKMPTDKTTFGGFLGVLRPLIINPFYLMLLLRVPTNRDSLIDSASQTTNIANISLAKLYPMCFGIPPLTEQNRIVERVYELMTLCDELEKEQTNSNRAHEVLVEVQLSTLTDAKNSDDFKEAWQRVAGCFDMLFTTEHSIDKLKQSILQLAVMGKLVSQDPTDEPASELLKKISKEKARLVKEGKIKKQAALPEVSEEEKPFELPNGWEWAKLGNIGIGATGKTPSTSVQSFFDGDIPFVGPGQIIPTGEIIEPDKFLSEQGTLQSTIAIKGDILMVCIGGSIGKSAIVKEQLTFNQQLNSIRPLIIGTNYVYLAINSPQFQLSILEKATGSATPIINRRKWEELLIPIPPMKEQIFIVSKIEELFVLCDSLKEEIRKTQEIQNVLAEEIVKRVVN